MSLSIHDPNCPQWYRRYVERKRVTIRKVRRGPGKKPGTLCTRDRRNRTGCVGISIVRTGGKIFFGAHGGGTNRKFCVNTLGRAEAWRRALRFRAQQELAVKGVA